MTENFLKCETCQYHEVETLDHHINSENYTSMLITPEIEKELRYRNAS